MPFRMMGLHPKHIYLIGICGTAMGSLAAMMKEKGHQVSGADAGVYPPMSDFLAQNEIPVRQGYRKENLMPRPDLVVVGNAIARGNEELEFVLDSGIPYTSLPEMIRLFFLQDKTSVVVTGTHGKTSTSSMAAWALENLGASPSFLIGGIPTNFKSSFQTGNGNIFVLEGDEYDTAFFDKAPKFFHYRPGILIITGIEYDHADIYPDLDSIILQFQRLINIVPANGFIAYSQDCPNTRKIVKQAFCKAESIGLEPDAVWQAVDIVTKRNRTRFNVLYQNQLIGNITLNVFGKYNVLNSLAVCSVLHHLAYPWEGVKSAMERYQGVDRRMTLRGEPLGVKVFDDFAHHPTAVHQTLLGARMRFPDSRIWAIFEPRSWTCRKNTHQKAMDDCFNQADVVIIADVYRKDQIPESQRYQPERTVTNLLHGGKTAHFIPTADEIVAFAAEKVNPGDVVVIMSNGGFDNIHQKLLERIQPHDD